MTYAQTQTILEFAAANGARFIEVDTDMGEVMLLPDEAKELYDNLAPGEAFAIISISW